MTGRAVTPPHSLGLTSSFWFWAAAITLARIVILLAARVDLGPDEAQYWVWSRDLALGYYSKPPLIGWTIALTTGLFGNQEWAVRLAAPLFHFGAAGFLYLAGRTAFDARIGFWAGLSWLALPGGILSAFLITTDAPLLFFWSAALYALARIGAQPAARLADFAGLGLAIGLGFLAKYAMIYFPIAIAAAALIDAGFRARLLKPALFVSVLVAFALVSLNLWWNANNDFSTLAHTADNANWSADLFHPVAALGFLVSQFAVGGVVIVGAFIAFLSRFNANRQRSGEQAPNWLLMLAPFALTPLIIVLGEAFLSRAHANWAASAYPAMTLIAVAYLAGKQRVWLLKAHAVLHLSLNLVFGAAMAFPVLADRAALASATEEIRGWRASVDALIEASAGDPVIAIDDRSLMGAALYYGRDSGRRFVSIDPNNSADNHYEVFMPYEAARDGRVLFVTTRADDAHVNYRFREIEPRGSISGRDGAVSHNFTLFEIDGYFDPRAPRP